MHLSTINSFVVVASTFVLVVILIEVLVSIGLHFPFFTCF